MTIAFQEYIIPVPPPPKNTLSPSPHVLPLHQRILSLLPDHSLPDFLTSLVHASFQEKLEMLDAMEMADRFRLALALLQRQVSVSRVSCDSQNGFRGHREARAREREREC